MHWQLVTVSLILLGFAAVSRRIDGTPITAPMLFTAAGLVVGVEALGLFDPAARTGTLAASLGAAVAAYERGASIFRVHDVREHVEALAAARAVLT